mmetsp:Transcript_8333/g.18011  ORF Transcript_8333/g.18011 Transcript_8333/m.18011 type:complete len:230 (+) Transcript_8333:439-1128(+)
MRPVRPLDVALCIFLALGARLASRGTGAFNTAALAILPEEHEAIPRVGGAPHVVAVVWQENPTRPRQGRLCKAAEACIWLCCPSEELLRCVEHGARGEAEGGSEAALVNSLAWSNSMQLLSLSLLLLLSLSWWWRQRWRKRRWKLGCDLSTSTSFKRIRSIKHDFDGIFWHTINPLRLSLLGRFLPWKKMSVLRQRSRRAPSLPRHVKFRRWIANVDAFGHANRPPVKL